MTRSNTVKTRFVSSADLVEIVRRVGLRGSLSQMLDYIESDFLRWSSFEKCARVASHSEQGVIELMPASDSEWYGFKYVNGHPYNYRFGLPTVMAFGLLSDVQTGSPRLLTELTLTTALRTAATSVMAAKALARPDSKVMAIIGNGAQSEFQALAFHHLLGIEQFHLYDIDNQATQKLMNNLEHLGLRAKAFTSTAQAVQGADILTTITADKTCATILTPDMIEPGMHINAVGGDCPGKTELHKSILENARVFVEFEPQTRIEGDIQQMPESFEVVELWRVLARKMPGRVSRDEVTVFDSVGFALEDFSAMRLVRDLSRRLNVGEDIELVPEFENPRNLFACLASAVGCESEV